MEKAIEGENTAAEMRRNMRAVIWYVALTFAVSDPCIYWDFKQRCPTLSESVGMAFPDLSLRTVIALAAVWVPAISALLVIRFYLHEDWRTTTLNRLGRKRYYIWAWLICPALTLIIVWSSVLSGLAKFDPNMLTAQVAGYNFGHAADFRRSFLLQLVPSAIYLPGLLSIQLMGEELGWRGFLLPRLMKAGLGQWKALILTGAIWGLWHAPSSLSGCFFAGHWFLGIIGMIVWLTLVGIIFGWLMLASGSVWVPAVAHAALDTISIRLTFLLDPRFNYFLVGSNGSLLGLGVFGLFIAWLVCSGRLPVRGLDVPQTLAAQPQPAG